MRGDWSGGRGRERDPCRLGDARLKGVDAWLPVVDL